MAKIEGIRVKNFRTLKDVILGRLWNQPELEPLTSMTVVIGKNGVGKSTLFDVFGFLADSLKFGVEEACDLRGRGGFEKIHSQGLSGALEFEILYSVDGISRPLTYKLSIDKDSTGRPYVQSETLFQYSDSDFFYLLVLNNGYGCALNDENELADISESIKDGFDMNQASKIIALVEQTLEQAKKEERDRISLKILNELALQNGLKEVEIVQLTDKRKLGIATLGSLKRHPILSSFRQFIEDWYLSYFTPDAARPLQLAGAQQHLNSKGDNLANVVQFMEREHAASFQSILNRIAEKIPGINKIDTEKTSDGRLLLRFNDKAFEDPFYAQQMSDGTLKVFAYLLLLEDPEPPPFICIEEPENGLYHKLLETLAREFREHATGRKGSSQLFITTHQPYFVDALEPNEVWILEKGSNGFSTIRRASDDELVKNMVAEGLPLGSLWYSDYLDAR